MKRTLHLGIVAATLAGMALFNSCTKEVQQPVHETAPVQKITQLDLTLENGILKFSTMDELEKTAWDIATLQGNGEKVVATRSSGFTSLYDQFLIAIDEMDAITTMEGVQEFKKKYAGIFLFNDTDPEDQCHYLPTSNSLMARVADIHGNVVVGDKLVNLKDMSDYKETMFYKTSVEANSLKSRAGTIEQSVNYLYAFNGRANKFWAEAKRGVGDYIHTVYMDVTAQRKKLLGWNHYTDNFYYANINLGSGAWDAASLGRFRELLNQVQERRCPCHTFIAIGETVRNNPYVYLGAVDFRVYSGEIGPEWAGVLKMNI